MSRKRTSASASTTKTDDVRQALSEAEREELQADLDLAVFSHKGFGGYDQETTFLSRRLAACGVNVDGLKCLDNEEYFSKTDLFKDGIGTAMEIVHKPTGIRFLLRFVDKDIQIVRHNPIFGWVARGWVERLDSAEVPEDFDDSVAFYHGWERALRQAERQDRDNRYSDLKAKYLKTLSQNSARIKTNGSSVYREAIVRLALVHGIRLTDLGELGQDFNPEYDL
ncbi:MAG: hypothetical protein HC902_01805 [Calothrix sp. SM1_5_4]|nr:hypothetical protein [Calothrix sp. SM1_5_4]